MLKLLRNKDLKKKIIWFVTVIIILSFGVFGTAYLIVGNGSTNTAGKIFGKKVPLDEFQEIYQQTVIQAKIRYGNKFTEVSRFLNLDSDTWDRLILLHEAGKQKITITDDEVVKTINSYLFFQRDGQFDEKLYNDILNFAFRTTPIDFEKSVRDSLKIVALYNTETTNVKIDEEEIYNIYKNQNERMQISYVFVRPDQFKDKANFNAAVAQTYYNNHKLDLIEPTTISIEYLSLDFPQEPETTEETQEPFDKTALRTQAQEIYSTLQDGKTFKDVTKDNDLELKTTGSFSMENPNLSLGWSYDLLNKLFALGKGDISSPLETEKRIIIATIVDKKESFIPTYEEAEEKIKDIILIDAARDIAEIKANKYLPQLKEEINKTKLQDFAAAAKTLNLEIHQTPIFNRGQYLPQIGLSKDFQEAAFNLTKADAISNVIPTTNGFCILHLDSYVPIDPTKYSDEKKTIKENLLTKRKSEAFNGYVTQIRLDANLEDNISKLKEESQQAQQTQL